MQLQSWSRIRIVRGSGVHGVKAPVRQPHSGCVGSTLRSPAPLDVGVGSSSRRLRGEESSSDSVPDRRSSASKRWMRASIRSVIDRSSPAECGLSGVVMGLLSARQRSAVNPAADERRHRVPRCPRRSASSRRRACFVGRVPRSAPTGRESRRSAACRSRASSDSGVSAYIVTASVAGPRRSATPVTTSVRRYALMVTSIVSPVRTAFEGFTRSPFTRTRPPRTAPAAAFRVLNTRAAQSHLSTRT